jgi:hypothetical protein
VWRLRLNGLIRRLPHANRYTLISDGIRIAVFCTKIYSRLLGERCDQESSRRGQPCGIHGRVKADQLPPAEVAVHGARWVSRTTAMT